MILPFTAKEKSLLIHLAYIKVDWDTIYKLEQLQVRLPNKEIQYHFDVHKIKNINFYHDIVNQHIDYLNYKYDRWHHEKLCCEANILMYETIIKAFHNRKEIFHEELEKEIKDWIGEDILIKL